MDVSDKNTILYYVVQTVYRRCVVAHLREVLTVAYGDDAPHRLRRPFKASDWDKKVEQAAKSAAQGVVHTPPVDDFDRLDVSQFGPLFEAEGKLLLPRDEGESEDAWRARRQRIVNQLGFITAARNPNSHPTAQDVSVDDLRYVIENARRVVESFDPVAETQLTSVLRDLEGPGKSPDAFLPPMDEIGGQFVGRTSQLDELWSWLKDKDAKRWLLMGPGGRGKTAIAYEFARQVREAAPTGIDMIVWLTAKRRALVDGTIRGRRPNFEDLPTALDYILTVTGFAGDADGQDLEAQRRYALELFRQFPTLLVVDDVDSLDERQDDAIEFFTEVAFRTKSKLLMTSRRQLLGLSLYSTLVEGLNPDDAQAFINSRANRYGIPVADLTKTRRDRMIGVTEASPLYLEDLMRLVGVSASIDQSIANWKQRGGDEARRYALGRELELLGENARQTLVAAALAGSAVSMDELRRITGRPRDEVEATLAELRKLFLVPRAQLVDGVERLSLDANSRSLVLDWARRDHPTMFERLSDSWRRIAGSSKRVGSRSVDAIALVRRSSALAADGDILAAEKVLLAGLGKEPNDAELHCQLGRIYASWAPARTTDARQHFERAEDLGGGDPDLYRAWIGLEIAQQEYRSAAKVGLRGIKAFPLDPELRLRTAEALWSTGHRLIQAGGDSSSVREVLSVLRPLVGDRPEIPLERRHREQAFRLTAYALAELIQHDEREARAGRSLGRNPADVVTDRPDRRDPAERERIQLRQVLNRWQREFPNEDQKNVAAKLKPLAR